MDWEKERQEAMKHPDYWIEGIKIGFQEMMFCILGLFKLIVKGGE